MRAFKYLVSRLDNGRVMTARHVHYGSRAGVLRRLLPVTPSLVTHKTVLPCLAMDESKESHHVNQSYYVIETRQVAGEAVHTTQQTVARIHTSFPRYLDRGPQNVSTL